MIPVFQDGSLPFQYTHKHSSSLRQALHTQKPTITFNELENLFSVFLKKIFLSVGGFLQSSAQPHESAASPLQRAAGHIKGIRPPLLILVAAMGKCKQANEFQLHHYGHPTTKPCCCCFLLTRSIRCLPWSTKSAFISQYNGMLCSLSSYVRLRIMDAKYCTYRDPRVLPSRT